MAGTVIDDMLSGFGRHPIPCYQEQIERSRLVREWLDWPGGPEAAPASVVRRGRRARERMVAGNMRLCVSVAKRFQGRGLPIEDLIQEGAIGLSRAVDKFDPTRGYKFSTYAYWWVRQSMTRAISDTADMIRVPCNSLEVLYRVQRFIASRPDPPSEDEILAVAGLDNSEQMERIRAALRAKVCHSTSIRLPDEKRTIEEILPCPNSEEAAQLERLEITVQWDRVQQALPHLTAKEREALELRHLMDVPVEVTARMMGIRRDQVSPIVNRAILRLKSMMARMDMGLPPVGISDGYLMREAVAARSAAQGPAPEFEQLNLLVLN